MSTGSSGMPRSRASAIARPSSESGSTVTSRRTPRRKGVPQMLSEAEIDGMEERAIRAYAVEHGMTVSQVVRMALQAKDDCWQAALADVPCEIREHQGAHVLTHDVPPARPMPP
jgi:hypothetical protein